MSDIPEMPTVIRVNARAHGLILTQDEREAIAIRASQGDQQARETIIRVLYRVAEKKAYRYSEMFAHCYGPCYVDVYQEGMTAGIAAVDRALSKYADPFPYLFKTMQNEMIEFCLYKNHLIRVYETRDKNGHAVHKPHPVTYISAFTQEEIDTLFPEEYRPNEQDTQLHQKLYAAIDKLRGRHKTVIEMRFGLNGHPVTGLQPISMHISGGKTKSMAGAYQSLALRHLRGALAQEAIR